MPVSFPSLSREGFARPDAFAMLRNSCRSACRSVPCPARESRATENTRRSFRPWARRRRCSGVWRSQRQRSAERSRGPASQGALVIYWLQDRRRASRSASSGCHLLRAISFGGFLADVAATSMRCACTVSLAEVASAITQGPFQRAALQDPARRSHKMTAELSGTGVSRR